jgi:hypothetical protein
MGFTKIGFLSLAGAGIVLIFQSVAGLMKFNASWITITLGKVTGHILDQYIVKIPYESVVNSLKYIVNTLELTVLLGTIGIICLIIGSFRKV